MFAVCRSLRLAIVISTGRTKGGVCSGGIEGGGERDGLHSCESGGVSRLFLFLLLLVSFGVWFESLGPGRLRFMLGSAV